MKTKSILLNRFMIFILLSGLIINMNSCKDKDEPTPEIVTENEVYFVIGEVLQGGKPLEGVKVSTSDKESTTDANGNFELELSKKGDYSVVFEKAGYVSITSKVTINSNAKNKASVAIKQELTKKHEPFLITPEMEEERSEPVNANISLDIPSGAVKESVEVYMTEFIPSSQTIQTGTINASLLSLNLEPDGLVFEKPVKISLKNPMRGEVRFDDLIHIKETNGVRQELGKTSYNADTHSYESYLSGFSNHYFVINTNVSSSSVSTELLDTEVIDNLGNMSARDESITMAQKYGWTFDGDLAGSIRSKYPTLTDASVNGLVSNISTAVASIMGSSAGVGTLNLSIPFRVSGDIKVTINFNAQVQNDTFSFPLIFVDGNLDWFEVSVKKYLGTEVSTTYQYGSSHTDHSGGSGQ